MDLRHIERYLLFTAVLIQFASCKKDEKSFVPVTGEYLPLQVHNFWEIKDRNKITITGTQVFENKTYYIVSDGSLISYYRNEKDKIYRKNGLSGGESLLYDFTASVNQEWNYELDGGTWNVKLLSKTDTVTINHTQVLNCYRFYFDNPMVADEENTVWLAPGIGFIKVKCMYCISNDQTLLRAEINKQLITFP